jgi:hypothetical protein
LRRETGTARRHLVVVPLRQRNPIKQLAVFWIARLDDARALNCLGRAEHQITLGTALPFASVAVVAVSLQDGLDLTGKYATSSGGRHVPVAIRAGRGLTVGIAGTCGVVPPRVLPIRIPVAVARAVGRRLNALIGTAVRVASGVAIPGILSIGITVTIASVPVVRGGYFV